ncbi:hypothetical protein [Leisingera sp. ANG-DT]|uniref:hypothetical protein n=1 Tax=Leisingera sp. ANG-DT TaxID=1577897 RepID=UPI00126A0483|nr:hypothetical protein [Leisingera sp. ANG-DT]
MTRDAHPILSVIVRRFEKKSWARIEELVRETERAVSQQPGFLGRQDNLSYGDSGCELVTVFFFDSHKNLENWELSSVRQRFVDELDRHSSSRSTQAKFDELTLLSSPKALISKIETVAILIFWILILGGLLDLAASALLPGAMSSIWLNILSVSVNVLLISYIFLPWTGAVLANLKARLFRFPRNTRP